MNKTLKKQELNLSELAGRLVVALGSPACRVGLKLKPEIELAEILDVGLRPIRNALSELEQAGILLRRRGSGTYLRRVPDIVSSEELDVGITGSEVVAEDILAAEQNSNLSHKVVLGKDTKRLHFELWASLHNTTSCNRLILCSITDALAKHGHRLSVHALKDDEQGNPLESNNLSDHLRGNPADGYIVIDYWADYFKKSLAQFDRPCLFFLPGTAPDLSHYPMVYIDVRESIHRAINIFADNGLERIAMIGIAGPGHYDEPERMIYNSAMYSRSLDYRCMYSFGDSDLAESIDQISDLLNSYDRPEAIYVADDFFMVAVWQAIKMAGLTPGEDIAIIAYNNKGTVQPGEAQWSTLETDLELFGQLIASELLRQVEQPDYTGQTMGVHTRWLPGGTHFVS